MYKIFISEKLKRKSIRYLFKVIDLFQSYDADWQTYFIDIDAEISNAERLTSIPTNCGALLFREFYFSEEKLLNIIGEKIPDKKYIEKFLKGRLRLEKIFKERMVERIVYSHPEIIDSVNIEIYFPLNSKINLNFSEKNIGNFKFIVELIETSYSYVNPKIIERILDESYFLHEYLEKLSKKYIDESVVVKRGYLLVTKGVIDASISLIQLEAYINRFLRNIMNYRNISMMFNRIF